MNDPIRVLVTGGAGQIAYNLLFRIGNGEVFADQPVTLHVLEIPAAMEALKGVVMELEDCAQPMLYDIVATDDLSVAFKDVNWALLVGSKPRGPGMERADLLSENGKIFVDQGRAINDYAADDVRVVVVGNPCNTNCLVAKANAPNVAANRWFAMTRLDENRAKAQIAAKAGTIPANVSHMGVWGNHSPTMYPDFEHAKVNGNPVAQAMAAHKDWLQGDFIKTVQQRGKAIIDARGKSSAASAANACLDTVRSLITPTAGDDWFSAAVPTDGNPYGVEAGLIFSFPVRSEGKGGVEIVDGLSLSSFAKEKVGITENELKQEREAVADLM